MSSASTPHLYKNGCREWYCEDRLHRVDGPAIEWADGGKEWYLDGQRHRDGGPAMTWWGGESWYQHGQLHREDGPAVTDSSGEEFWWLHGVSMTKEEFNLWLKKKSLNDKLHASLQPKHHEKKNKI